jgi:sortase (surface protein transpeptidase)
MSLLNDEVDGVSASAPAGQDGQERAQSVKSPLAPRAFVVRTALLIVSGMLLGFAFNLILMSPLRHFHDQQNAYAQFRNELANAVAPVSGHLVGGGIVPVGDPIALLQIPTIGVNEVVLNGTSSTVLMSGPGYQRDTAMPGQVGHSIFLGRATSFGGPFAGIAALPMGTQITVITGQGQADYVVSAVRHSGDPIVRLQPGEGRLTLATADGAPYVPNGLVEVDAKLTSPPADPQGTVVDSALLAPSEQALAGDSSAAVGLVMWSALLLAASVALVWMSLVWGRWQVWIVAVPVIAALGVAVSNHIVMLLPNLM